MVKQGPIRGLVAIALSLSLSCLTLGLPGCSGSGAEGLLDTAALEEKQNNLPHARKLYEEIVRKYPDTEQARKAEARLAELGKGQ